MSSLRFPDIHEGSFESPTLQGCLAVLDSTQEVFSALRSSLLHISSSELTPKTEQNMPEGVLGCQPCQRIGEDYYGREEISLTVRRADSPDAHASISLQNSLQCFNIAPRWQLEVGEEQLVPMDKVHFFASTRATVGKGYLHFRTMFEPFNATIAPEDYKNIPGIYRTQEDNTRDIPPTPDEIARLNEVGANLVKVIERVLAESH